MAIRPRKPGLRLRLYNRAVFLFIQFGPLIRERIALRNRRLSASSQDLLLDVVRSGLGSASDSALWPPIEASLDDETRAIGNYLRELADTLWKDIDEPESLAGRVRAALGAPAPR